MSQDDPAPRTLTYLTPGPQGNRPGVNVAPEPTPQTTFAVACEVPECGMRRNRLSFPEAQVIAHNHAAFHCFGPKQSPRRPPAAQ